MVKRTIIYSIVYSVILFSLILYNLNSSGMVSVVSILLPTIIFVVLFIKDCIIPSYKNFKPTNDNLFSNTSAQLDTSKVKKISAKSSFFGLEKLFLENQDYYFDMDNFYAMNTHNRIIKIPLTTITEVSKTSIRINSTRIWQVKATYQNQLVVFKFSHNYTLLNKNFALFLDEIRKINPAIVKNSIMF